MPALGPAVRGVWCVSALTFVGFTYSCHASLEEPRRMDGSRGCEAAQSSYHDDGMRRRWSA